MSNRWLLLSPWTYFDHLMCKLNGVDYRDSLLEKALRK